VAVQGQNAVVTALSSGAEVPGAVAYVWRLWDGSVKTTSKAATSSPINRSLLQATAIVCDKWGRAIQKNLLAQVPDLPGISAATTAGIPSVLPFYVQLSVTPTSPAFTVIWTDADGNVFATGNAASYQVTSVLDQVYATISDPANPGSQVVFDFSLPGTANEPPSLTQIASGAAPAPYISLLSPATVATTSAITLAGVQLVDNYQIPAAWAVPAGGSAYAKIGACRVLVKNQLDPKANGVYLATTGPTPLALVSSLSVSAGQIAFAADLASAVVSTLDASGNSALTMLANLAVPGGQIIIKSGAVSATFQVASLSFSADGSMLSLTFSANSSGAALVPGACTLDFGWVRAADTISSGSAARVINGSANGGHTFAAVVLNSSGLAATLGADQIKFYDASVDYSGTTADGAVVYIENSTVDSGNQVTTCQVDLPLGAESLTLNSGAQYLVRSKISSGGLVAGLLAVEVQVTNTNPGAPASAQAEAEILLD
jgi:hypothetical protein